MSRIARGLVILLLPAGLPDNSHATAIALRRVLPPGTSQPVPYLQATGPLPLRFREAPLPPPAPVARPVAGGPPLPAAETIIPDSAPAPGLSEQPAASAPESSPAPATAASVTPPALLRDESRSKVRAEDFLPFFQFPASGDVTVVSPIPTSPATPVQPIPSSVTYRQQ